MLVTILSIVLVAMTPGGFVPSNAPVLPGGGGPDAYGYMYLDSDTTCPGAPTYNWVSIKGVGTEITSLGDDNTAVRSQSGSASRTIGTRSTRLSSGPTVTSRSATRPRTHRRSTRSRARSGRTTSWLHCSAT